MATNRALAQKMILDFMSELDLSGYNKTRYEEIFKNMSDKDFHDYMVGIRNGEKTLVVFAPLMKSKGISTENNLKIAEKYNIPMFERIKITNSSNPDFTTEQKYLLLDLPIRRQSQNLVKKISVPDNNKTIDYLTYQPTGDSKGSSLSKPELGIINSMGLYHTTEELFRFRGGDKGGFRAYNGFINQYGSVNLEKISPYLTGVESTKAVKSYLLAMGMVLKDNEVAQ